ncbi:MAG: BMP family ABC transporter substrate-binding protein [Ardenticatenales bacterium]|nr:BMP family ABC transporter substrate-binding protein [Ardenticatenales bacterium]
MIRDRLTLGLLLLGMALVLGACGERTIQAPEERLTVGVLLGGNEDDKGFNEFTLKGAQEAATELGLEFVYFASPSVNNYEQLSEQLIAEKPSLFIAVSIPDAGSLAQAAQRHPEIKFALMDQAYFPGFGCAETVTDCYSPEGGLSNVTSLLFAEDEVAYLAGVLAACMSESHTIASVAGREYPALVRFVTGFQSGARSVKPEIVTLNEYLPSFDDPALGEAVAQGFINEGADVLFAVAGNSGNGALLAAQNARVMAIGVDVDQYHSYPEVRSVLLTSAMKNVDVAAGSAVRDFAAGQLIPGIRTLTVANGGLSLAPYHDWEEKIPADCKANVEEAEAAIKADPTITGAKP